MIVFLSWFLLKLHGACRLCCFPFQQEEVQWMTSLLCHSYLSMHLFLHQKLVLDMTLVKSESRISCCWWGCLFSYEHQFGIIVNPHFHLPLHFWIYIFSLCWNMFLPLSGTVASVVSLLSVCTSCSIHFNIPTCAVTTAHVLQTIQYCAVKVLTHATSFI